MKITDNASLDIRISIYDRITKLGVRLAHTQVNSTLIRAYEVISSLLCCFSVFNIKKKKIENPSVQIFFILNKKIL